MPFSSLCILLVSFYVVENPFFFPIFFFLNLSFDSYNTEFYLSPPCEEWNFIALEETNLKKTTRTELKWNQFCSWLNCSAALWCTNSRLLMIKTRCTAWLHRDCPLQLSPVYTLNYISHFISIWHWLITPISTGIIAVSFGALARLEQLKWVWTVYYYCDPSCCIINLNKYCFAFPFWN